MNLQDCKFLTVWEFRVRPGGEACFEAVYGPAGAWAKLFGADPAYGGTRLIRDERDPMRYLTLDFWASQADYELFQEIHAAEYSILDTECENLTERETEIGLFADVPARL